MTISGVKTWMGNAARGMRSAAAGLGSAARSVGAGVGTGARAARRLAHRATNASGAGRSGLANLIELHTVNHASDALVAVGLAGTLFFGVPVDQARGRVALYLLITMAPFAVVAPLIGPALDRMRSGRRYALAGTMLARGLLCWAMASAVLSRDTVTLFPAAFGVLVLTKAYNISRTAVVPRVLPSQISLVSANARMTLAGTVGAGIAVAVGTGLAALAGPAWVLRVTTVVFLAGTALAVRLPSRVDSAEDARDAEDTGETLPRPGRARLGPIVVEALGANAALRAFSGFLILYLAFLLRTAGFPGIPQAVALGTLVVLAGAGGLVGTSIGAWARSRAPEVLVLITLGLATAVAALSAWLYGFIALAVVATVAGLGQALGKLGLDALIQRDVTEHVRSSAFARSETLLQLSWVVGGGLGLGLSLVPNGTLGLALAAAGLATALAALMAGRIRRPRRMRHADPAHETPPPAGRPDTDRPDDAPWTRPA